MTTTATIEGRRIHHRLPPARWPTAEEAAGALWFSPIRLGTVVAEQRTWVPAMVPWRATEDGFVTPEVLEWYGRFAEGQPGVLVVEATGIRDIRSGPLLRIGDDRFIPDLGDDVVAGGSDVEDAAWFGLRFAEADVDYLSISKGGRFEDAKQPKVGEAVYPYTGESGYECMPTVFSDERGPFSRNVPLAGRIRSTLRAAGFGTPVVTSGGIRSFEQAEGILRRGEADVAAAARQTLADPDWFCKIRLGDGHLVRPCEFTNYCEGLDQRHKQVTCKLWDRLVERDDPTVPLATDGRRRLSAPGWLPPAP